MSLSKLYTNIGFHRKASFYRRLTATRYVSARNPQTNWDQCYQLMLQSLPGYNLSLDPNEYTAGEFYEFFSDIFECHCPVTQSVH